MPIKIRQPRTIHLTITDSTGDTWNVEVKPIPKALIRALESKPEELADNEEIVRKYLVSVKSSQLEATELTDEDREKLLEILPGEVVFLINAGILKATAESITKNLGEASAKNLKQPSS